MQSRARLPGRHPMHPSLIAFPVALLPIMLLLDALYWIYGDVGLWTAGFWLGVAGIVTTIAAMVPGIIDMAAIPSGTPAHKIGVWHAAIGSIILVAYAASVAARWPVGSGADRVLLVTAIDAVGSLLIVAQGWLGGELVYKHHMGVLADNEGGEPVDLTKSDAATRAQGRARRRGAERP